MSGAGLAVVDVSAGYVGGGKDAADPVLEGIDFSLPVGDCLAIVGRSGCGKSTLLNILAGVLPPATGAVRIGGVTVAAGDRRRAGAAGGASGHAAYLFQQDLLLPWKDALANAVFAARVAGHRMARAELLALEQRAAELLREFGLGDSLRARPDELSGGMRQRVALARTMLMDRELILLDEPFGSLDAVTRAEMRRWLLDVMAAHPATWVLVTHDVDEAVLLGDHVAALCGRPARLECWSTAAVSRAHRQVLAAVAAGESLCEGTQIRAGDQALGLPASVQGGPTRSAVETAASAAARLRRALVNQRMAS